MSDPRYVDSDNLDHAPDIANALGQMVAAWARAETILSWAFARVFDIHPNRAFFGYYRVPTFEARINLILSMMDSWETTQYDKAEISKLIGKIKDQAEARNTWTHGVWCKDRDTNETVIFRFRKPEDKGRLAVVRVADITNHLVAVRATTEALALAVDYRIS